MPRNPEFTRRFNELTAGQSQYVVAGKVGLSQAYINQIRRGLSVPSKAVVERLADAYGQDRHEWLVLAGYVPSSDAVKQALDLLASVAEETPEKFKTLMTDGHLSPRFREALRRLFEEIEERGQSD